MKKEAKQDIQLKQLLISSFNENLQMSPPHISERDQIKPKQHPENKQKRISMQQFQQDNSSSQSDDEAEKLKDNKYKQQLMQQNLKKQANQKVVVGTGFSMDVTQFFQFNKKKQLSSNNAEQPNMFEQISGSRLAWVILMYSVVSGAMIPGWIMNIQANKLLKISWRFFMQSFMVIPFVLYEYRTGDQNVKKKYTLEHIFDPRNLIKPLVSSFAASMWFTMVLSGFEWTSVSHSIVLGSLSNFFLSIGRSMRHSSHDLQLGGQMLVFSGVALVLIDSYLFSPQYLAPATFTVVNVFYYSRKWWEKIAFDLNSFSISFYMAQFSKYTSDLKNYYPPFLSMFIVNIFNTIHMAFSCYFINGCDWGFDSFFGIWSLFSNLHFSGFMYMAIILALGQIVSLVMISRMFPDPIIPALAMTLEPFIASFILDITDVQKLPAQFTIIGYLLMVPGLCLILVGQYLFQRMASKKQEEQKRAATLIKELKDIQEKEQDRNDRIKTRKTKFSKHSIKADQQIE